jgi:hypothetical protein
MSTNYINPYDITKNMNYFPYQNVTNEMINNILSERKFVDTKNGEHSYGDKTKTTEHHAQRIASLIDLLYKEIELDIVTLYIDEYKTETIYSIDDGHHRWRAYLYLNKNMPIIISKESWS